MSVRKGSTDLLVPDASINVPAAQTDATERELAGDAQWKIIQKNCFTRWTNEHLKTVSKHVADLETDLSDGLRLIALVEVLSGKRFLKFNKRPNFRTMKLENVTMALKFLEDDEGIKIVNIDSSDIVDHKLKLILGLIWTLILHYSISMPVWEDEEGRPQKQEQTPKQRLLGWIQGKLPDKQVGNFTTDWNDGKAIGALVDGVAPGLCPDWESWNPKNKLENATEAMNAAEQWLDVPQLIQPAEMCNPNVDELSMMTYLSQFPSAKLKTGAPLRPKTNPARVRAFGPGLQPTGNSVGAPARFTVETFSAGRGDLEIVVINPNGVQETCEKVFNKDRNLTYSCHYTPTMEGQYTITIKFAGQDISKSPFVVGVKGMAGDPSKVTASGPGLEKTGVIVKQKTHFEVHTKNAGMGVVDVVILDPHGHKDTTRPLVTKKSDELWLVEYAAAGDGLHSVNVFFAGKSIPNSPFGVGVSPAVDPRKCYVTGRGVQANGIRVGDEAVFIVHTAGAGDGDLKVEVVGPGGVAEKVKIKKIDATTYECVYEPKKTGEYIVNVTFGGGHVFKSPFVVEVGPTKPTKIRVYGPGLEEGYAHQPACFTVETNGETGALGFSIEGPSQAKISCDDNNDGSANVSYLPTEPGEYAIHVLCDEEDIQGSPWMANIKPATTDFDASKVTASGLGIGKEVMVNEPVEFIIDTSKAGRAPLKVTITDEDHKPVDVSVKDNKDGTFLCRYVPKKAVKHVVVATFGGVMIPNFPARVNVTDKTDPSKVKIGGPAFDGPVKANQPTSFTIDCSKAGAGDIGILMTDTNGDNVPLETTNLPNNAYKVAFTPEKVGPCTAHVYFADQEVPNSPLKFNVEPGAADASKVQVYGDGVKPTGVLASLPVSFTVDASKAGHGDLDVVIQDPEGNSIQPEVKKSGDGKYNVTYTPEGDGKYKIPVNYGGKPVPNSPFNVNAAPTGDASKVLFADNVKKAVPVGKVSVFKLDPSKAGKGRITCRIDSKADNDVDVEIIDNGDGTVDVAYTPKKPGQYDVDIKFGGKTIPNGKFTQQAFNPEDLKRHLENGGGAEDLISPERVRTVGSAAPGSKGAEEGGPYHPVEFCLPVGPIFSFVSAEITTPSKKKHRPKVVDKKDGTVAIHYSPSEVGLHYLNVTYNDVPIEGSPFQFYVDSVIPGHVTAYGPGLSHGVSGKKAEFTIVTKDAGSGGGLALAVEGPSKAEMNCVDNGDGTCSVSYVPTAPGEYAIKIMFDDKDITGSPFKAKISPASDLQKAHVGADGTGQVALKIAETDLSSLTANIRYPSGKEEPCSLKRLDNGQLGIGFEPKEVGEHLVSVFKHGQHIPNSPFKIYVGEKEIGNASRVRAYGKGLEGGVANELNEFYIDTKDAGYGGLSLSVEGPSKADIECNQESDGLCRVRYKPTEPGNYIVNVKFADEHINGSPFMVKVGGQPAGQMSEKILRERNAPDVTHVGSECELSLKIPAINVKELEAVVISPSGASEPCEVSDLGDNEYSIKFVPKEIGVHTVSVKHKGIHIPGSPFQFTVGPITEGGSHKVRAHGPGLERGEVHVPCYFSIYTREAGAGSLSIAMEGPSKAEIDFQDKKDGSCEVAYTCSEPGDYIITIRFNDQNIPDSPFKVYVAPSSGDRKRMDIRELQEHGCQLNKPAAFTVDMTGTKGKLDARVVAPSGAEDEAIVQEIDKDHCAVRFVPRENGIHKVFVRQNGVPIAGSPFHILVGKVDADPALVQASGDGLSKGRTGQLAKFLVKTANAGSGALGVTVDGPSKVKLACHEVPEGYEFSYTPTAAGDYLISIKYGGNNHIPGSPFKAHIVGDSQEGKLWNEQSQVVVETVTKSTTTSVFSAAQLLHDADASKVRSEGSGLQKAFINKEATFTVDTSQAGHNMLLVGVMGPKIPCQEVSVRHVGGGRYTIIYRPEEVGNHLLVVKWGDKHIPGSPFHIVVV